MPNLMKKHPYVIFDYYSIAFRNMEVVFNINIQLFKRIYLEEREKMNYTDLMQGSNVINFSFIGPVLHSSDGEVRTFGFRRSFISQQLIMMEYELHKTNIGNKFIKILEEFDWDFKVYKDAYLENVKDTNLPKMYHKINVLKEEPNVFKYHTIIYNFAIYYLYIKFMYGQDLSNIESKDAELISYMDSKFNLDDNEMRDLVNVFNETIYVPYKLLIWDEAHIIKITPAKYDNEWLINAILYRTNNTIHEPTFIIIALPSYESLKYSFHTEQFMVNDKLIFKLKFNDTKVLDVNIYMGLYMGKSLYQNLLDIKNNSKNAIYFSDADYHNIVIMNLLNIRVLNMLGFIHNDLHLNNILFKRESDYIPHNYTSQVFYKFKVSSKFFLHLGKIDFTIIDFGRSCSINAIDVILRRIKKLNRDFYDKYNTRIIHMFEQDGKMTGYVMSLFDHIEYMQSIILGFKWINDEHVDFVKWQSMVDYCYEILETYLTGNNKKIAKQLVELLNVKHYRLVPELAIEFINPENNISVQRLWNKISPIVNNSHPIDLVIKKFFPENIYVGQAYDTMLYTYIKKN